MRNYNDGFVTVCARTTHMSVWQGDRAKILIRDLELPDVDEIVTVRLTDSGNIEIHYSPSLLGRLTCKPGDTDELS